MIVNTCLSRLWFLSTPGKGPRVAVLAAVALVAAVGPATAQEWSMSFYIQQAFPKQTNTNKQIEAINATFGSDFDTWDDVANLSIGTQLYHRVSDVLLVGGEFDYSRGSLDGTATVETEAGPAELAFEQKYSVFANLLFAAKYLPCRTCSTVVPFAYGALGVAYEKDTTTLTLRNEYLDEDLRVENDGWFPAYTAGIGLDLYPFANKAWYLEVGTAYYWGRLTHMVPASGSLAPAPEVEADTDSTGPNYWLGFGVKF